jgi:alkyl hydroperoxide reductase subunit F
MLDASLKTQLKAYLEKVVQPIELVAALDDSAKARDGSTAAGNQS